jgi:cytoskeletal protein CcmA (bactofilin family)
MAKAKKIKPPRTNTIIGPEVEIVGDISFSGGLYIAGRVIGKVNAEDASRSTLTVADSGCIEGDVKVPNLILGGVVTGDVRVAQTAELIPGAKVQGTVYYQVLEMAMGAEVNGQLVCTDSKRDEQE